MPACSVVVRVLVASHRLAVLERCPKSLSRHGSGMPSSALCMCAHAAVLHARAMQAQAQPVRQGGSVRTQQWLFSHRGARALSCSSPPRMVCAWCAGACSRRACAWCGGQDAGMRVVGGQHPCMHARTRARRPSGLAWLSATRSAQVSKIIKRIIGRRREAQGGGGACHAKGRPLCACALQAAGCRPHGAAHGPPGGVAWR